jgi:hypothetical protein
MSFRQKPESSIFNTFWIPDQVRNDKIKIFSKLSQGLTGHNQDYVPALHLLELPVSREAFSHPLVFWRAQVL